MQKTYIVELIAYPQEFTISAESKEKALEIAKARFGRSVYESNVEEQEDA